MLHITKVAVGCADADMLAERLTGRAIDGESWVPTRYRPTRHEELIGGSLYWIVKHQLIARSRIIGFDEVEGRCRIRVDADLVPVRIRPRRAHQGWRYLTAEDAPGDLDGAVDDLAALPPGLMSELAALRLI
jgi:hypothetical protein